MREVAVRLWSLLGGDPSTPDRLELAGDQGVLPSVFDVTGMATAAVAVATLAAAELHAARNDRDVDEVAVTTREASAAFRCENLFVPDGWNLPPIWDPIAGDYETADGWIRLHTNYRHHRAAVFRALGLQDGDGAAVAENVAGWKRDELEARVVEEGGAAAAMRAREEWLNHPQGRATASELPIELTTRSGGHARLRPPSSAPLGGVRVLDLTRVIAGPFATRFLAAWGADVLRIDPPGFEEVPAIIPEATAGKRCAFLDLGAEDDHARFLDLVSESNVVVHGYRPGALDGFGLGDESLREANPGLIISQHDAYGWSGPWSHRRGFDSLVQMSCGIAAAGGVDRPRPLPAQALDHATGMLIAAAVCRALTTRERAGTTSDVRASLIGVANFLYELPDPIGVRGESAPVGLGDTEPRRTWWGPARAVPIPGCIGRQSPRLPVEPGPLGRHEAAFSH